MRLGRILDRARDAWKRGLVKNYLGAVHGFSKGDVVVQVTLDEIEVSLDLFQIFAKTRSEIIQNLYPGTLSDEFLGEVGTDKSRTARNQYFRRKRHIFPKDKRVKSASAGFQFYLPTPIYSNPRSRMSPGS